ncbi:MAG: metal/formaldehyde-sensitive transcriptional repressor [Pyrinomonadaceae bacterium]
MAHILKDKKKLLNRTRRIRGQIEAIERMIEEETEGCTDVLQLIASCRGAINGLMAEVIEGHIRFHIIDPDKKPTREQTEAAQEVIEVVNRYLK